MIQGKKILVGIVLFFLWMGCGWALRREAAVFDLSERNGENQGSRLSVEHALQVAGIPYEVTADAATAVQFGMVVIPNRVASSLLQAQERRMLTDYVQNGGILVVSRLTDTALYPLFGVQGEGFSNSRYTMSWNTAGGYPELRWFDDPMEQTISLGKPSRGQVITSVSYTMNGAEPLAFYADGTAAGSRRVFGLGCAYNLGVGFREMIILNLLNKDYDAERVNQNGYEPTTDTIMLLLRAIYQAHVPNACWKHTCPRGYRSALIITHDVDSVTAMDNMNSIADLENSHGVRTTYNVTTSYVRDQREIGNYGGYYNAQNILRLRQLLEKNQRIGSHSVGHFPDFDLPEFLPPGAPGNTQQDYRPYFDGTHSHNASLYGEFEVSRNLLQADTGGRVFSFRSGHLLFNNKMVEIMDAVGFRYDSSCSAHDLLTNFPFRMLYDRASDGRVSGIYEIPLTISDVFHDDPITSENYPQKVNVWLDVIRRNLANFAPTVLLVHPNSATKLAAEHSLFEQLDKRVICLDMDGFGDFWRTRDQFTFRSSLQNGRLVITVPDSAEAFCSEQGIVIERGADLAGVQVLRQNGEPMPFSLAPWDDGALLVQLGVDFTVRRFTETAWSFQRDVARIEFRPPTGNMNITRYVLLRRCDDGAYIPVQTIPQTTAGGVLQYTDRYLQKDHRYSYKIEIYNSQPEPVLVTHEETI